MRFLYDKEWRQIHKPLLFPNSITARGTDACIPGEQSTVRVRPSRMLLLREILQRESRLLKRSWKYRQAIGLKRGLAKVRLNVAAYENGPFGSTAAIVRVLNHLEEDESLRRQMGEASRMIIENFSPSHWCQGALRALEVTGLKAN